MGKHSILALWLAAAAALACSAPVAAQCRLCDQPTTDRPQDKSDGDVQLQIEAGLNFDRLILCGAGSGAATIRADGSTGAEGIVTQVGPRAMVGSATVHGEAGRAVRVEIPRRIELYSLDGGRLALVDVASDLPPIPRLDASGNLSFRFGGRLIITGDADGPYRGDLPITVDYDGDAAVLGEP
jgi:hypothetical protein